MKNLEQLPPNKPNFLVVVLLFAGAIVAVFIIAYIVLELGGTRIIPKHHSKEPHSQLVLPASSSHSA
jgi:hypothetical protein